MPRRSTKKWSRKGRKQSTKTAMSKSLLVPIAKQVHRFRRNYEALSIVGNVAYAPYQQSFDTRLSYLPNASEFGNLYDQFKITYVVHRFFLEVDPSAQTASGAVYPKLYYVRDQDSLGLLSLAELRERSNLKIKVLSPNRPVIVKYKPNCLTEIYRGAVSTSYQPKWNTWLDMVNQDVSHFGLIFAIDDFKNTNYKLSVQSTIYFACRNTR